MSDQGFSNCRIHPTALIEDGVCIGDETSVWDNVHVRRGATIGRSCIIGEKTYIAYDVKIGNYCKLNAGVYVCTDVTINDYVMLAAHTVFTNDRYPRAFDITLDGLATSDPTEETLHTTVGVGVTTGANVTIGPGLRIGDFAMIGMGSVVTRDVPAHGLVVGNPAHIIGFVCACGPVVSTLAEWNAKREGEEMRCDRCGRKYAKVPPGISEIVGPKGRLASD